jgi:hypothetical protein
MLKRLSSLSRTIINAIPLAMFLFETKMVMQLTTSSFFHYDILKDTFKTYFEYQIFLQTSRYLFRAPIHKDLSFNYQLGFGRNPNSSMIPFAQRFLLCLLSTIASLSPIVVKLLAYRSFIILQDKWKFQIGYISFSTIHEYGNFIPPSLQDFALR